MENSQQTLAADTQIVTTTAAAAPTVVINIPNEEEQTQTETETVCPNAQQQRNEALELPTTPSPLPSPTTTPAKAGLQHSSQLLYSAASMQSLAYDTDCSSASSTCCTRYGEHIYMQRCTIDMLEAANEKPKSKSQAKDNANVENGEVYTKVELYKNKWPVFIVLISLIEIAIFVYDYLSLQQQQQANAATINFAQNNQDPTQTQQSLTLPVPIPTDSVFIYRPDRRLEVWRFVSYMFLHANSFHLGFNVVVQLFYGIPLEVMHGSARIAIIYFAGVFAGSLGTSVVDSDVYLVGASGGVYALLAAHLANITLNFGQMRYAVAQLCSVVIFVTCDLAYAFYTQYLAVALPSKTPPVSYIAHLTGALAGLTIGLLVLKNFEQRSYENVIWWLALGIYSAFTIFAVVFNLINTVTAQLMEEEGEVITQHLLHDLGVS